MINIKYSSVITIIVNLIIITLVLHFIMYLYLFYILFIWIRIIYIYGIFKFIEFSSNLQKMMIMFSIILVDFLLQHDKEYYIHWILHGFELSCFSIFLDWTQQFLQKHQIHLVFLFHLVIHLDIQNVYLHL